MKLFMDLHRFSLVSIGRMRKARAVEQDSPRSGLWESSAYDRTVGFLQASVSLLALVILSPLFLIISLLIKVTSPGPAFYRGERVGRRKRFFHIYKFRTLVVGAEQKIGGRLLNDEDRYRCLTLVGKFLKRSKLDELPQLWNVVKGEMRLVGPRPIRPVFLEKLEREIPNFAARFHVPPGLTGIAQLRGGYYTSPRNKHRYDLIYIQNHSLFLDLKLILLTFVKILNHWLSMGCVLLFFFIIVSFVPARLRQSFYLSLYGLKIEMIYILITAAAAWMFVKKGLAPFSLYRCPLNLPMLSFLVISFLSVLLSETPYQAFRGASYYLISGFLIAFLIVNTLAKKGFVIWTVRTIALSSVVMSLLGLFQIFILNFAFALASGPVPQEGLLEGYTRISSVLGSPSILAVYLVLGIPLLLSELTQARTLAGRDFWLVCTTLSFIGVFLTQSRIGLVALLVTGAVFLYRHRNHFLSFFVVPLVAVLLLVSLGLPRFSVSRIEDEGVRWVREKVYSLQAIPAKTWLIGAGAKTTPEIIADAEGNAGEAPKKDRLEIANMHLTLIWEYGMVGWAIVMWLILAAVHAMKQAHDRAKDDHLKNLLWAIISSVVGFLISMNGLNAFHNLTIQIFFWSLIGIGLGIVIHLNGERRHNLIWRFGDAGD